MQDWTQVIQEHYAVAYDPAEFSMSLNPPATLKQIEDLERSLGFTFPEEWHALYKTTNGLGVVPKKQPTFVSDLFPSIEHLPAFIATSRDWISPTHPHVALRYIPVLDFVNGDTIGYCTDDESATLYLFNHESKGNDPEQDTVDFLYPIAAKTLQQLLLP